MKSYVIKYECTQAYGEPALEAMNQFLEIMDKLENLPMLVHCDTGSHNGALCRIEKER